uniref:protein-serine/threonine phosphatase n=1 Tax=Acrobeloides nanus TaxID=290746 RepID=A0A914DAV4_9BILA
MSLISVQRSPTPTEDDLDAVVDSEVESLDDQKTKSSILTRNRSLSEFYFTVKGAAVILSHSDYSSISPRSQGHEIEGHLQAMLRILRPHDTLSMAVRLQSSIEGLTRYLAVVSTVDESENREVGILGFDYLSSEQITVGVTVPILSSTKIELDGDGGIKVDSNNSLYLFKPVSIQAMWTVFQCLHKELSFAQKLKGIYFSGPWSHSWMHYYDVFITKDDSLCALWHYSVIDDAAQGDLKATSVAQDNLVDKPAERMETENLIRSHLKQIMQSVDLDDVTSKDIRIKLEEQLKIELSEYKEFIDREMLVILGQMEKPSKIFDYLFLGTEWNASNWEELKDNKVEYILNMTKEVDNFFPAHFKYLKIWVSDEANTELLMHWQKTYDFIKEAKERGSAVLVHCKKGISRSSSTVIAYIMKEYNWSLEQALNHVKLKRDCITPNHGFMKQLTTFDGMLQASSNRHSAVFNSLFTSSIIQTTTPDGTQTIAEIETSDLIESIPSSSHSDEIANRVILRGSNSFKLPSISRCNIFQNCQCDNKSSQFNTVNSNRSRAHTAPSAEMTPVSLPVTGQSISNLALDRSNKYNSGRVKKHRDKFEGKSERKSAPASSSIVDDFAKRISCFSVTVEQNTLINSDNSSYFEESSHVKNLVGVFERGRNIPGSNKVAPQLFHLTGSNDWNREANSGISSKLAAQLI